MPYIQKVKKYYYIIERRDCKRIYLKNLGAISKEEAVTSLKEYNQLNQFKKKNPMPEGVFDIIYADPPWKYNDATPNRRIENHYPTMDLVDICKLSIPSANNSILFLWSTPPQLESAFQVIKSWGFQYKTCAVWDKQRLGMGYYFRGQHELLLISIKGKPGHPDTKDRLPSIITSIRTEHSKKPDLIYEVIEKMYPNHRYLELFARKKINDKWTVWGNEIC
ncbi:MAG TPA: MT-A70 family methyltransferase [Candidatus Methylomirabilis sp.]|nr:MT-A70 family methyltransferase [Candidatus Methylomirabilis sp.]